MCSEENYESDTDFLSYSIPIFSAGSESEESDTEHVTSTVPELVESNVLEDMQSNHISWLHRCSRTPSPKDDNGRGSMGKRKGGDVRVVGKASRAGSGSSRDRWGVMSDQVTSKRNQPYKPVLIVRDNKVHDAIVFVCVARSSHGWWA